MTNTALAGQKLLNVAEAAATLHVNPGTIRRWAQTGHLLGIKVGIRGDWRFTENALNSVTRSNHHDAGAQTEYVKHSEHQVQFYEKDSFLITTLTSYVSDSIHNDETCILIATEEHIASLSAELETETDIDMAEAMRTGSLVVYDAAQMLEKFVINDRLDLELFDDLVGGVLQQAVTYDRPINAYGEMVAMLWQRDQQLAVDLEKAWNTLANKYEFKLLCTYQMDVFNQHDYRDLFDEINDSHSHVIPTEAYTTRKDQNEHDREIARLQQRAKSLENEVLRRKELTKLNVAKDEFISIASHQLRTPATGVKQYLGLLVEGYLGELSEEQHHSLSKAYESNERQLKIVDDLLLVARINSGEINLKPELTDMSEVITDVIEEQRAVFERKKQTLSIDTSLNLRARVDGLYTRMVIENILNNASKYSPENTEITLKAFQTSTHLVINIVDQGIGIDENDHDKLFVKFSRIYNKQSVEGNGLGLYWSKKIIDLHGGELTLKSAAGKGSTFTISLPL